MICPGAHPLAPSPGGGSLAKLPPGCLSPRQRGFRPFLARHILGVRVAASDYAHARRLILSWARRCQSRSVCFATVHSLMEAHDSPAFRQSLNAADLLLPDGMPLVWGLHLLGLPGASRVYGPDLTLFVLEAAARRRIPVGFYGSAPDVLRRLLQVLARRCPGLVVAYACSPPFRPPTPEEDEAVVRNIRLSGARILFVGLGCPRQESWMTQHRGRLPCVMLGVGAAFDFLSGAKPQAPRWMMRCGLEWLFRLLTEPRRLWKRYLKHNPRFLFHFSLQLLGFRRPALPLP